MRLSWKELEVVPLFVVFVPKKAAAFRMLGPIGLSAFNKVELAKFELEYNVLQAATVAQLPAFPIGVPLKLARNMGSGEVPVPGP